MAWNPETHPYRVRWVYSSSTYGLMGWRDRVATFPTEQEARQAFAATERGAVSKGLDVAINPSTWLKNGHWKSLMRWKRPKVNTTEGQGGQDHDHYLREGRDG